MLSETSPTPCPHHFPARCSVAAVGNAMPNHPCGARGVVNSPDEPNFDHRRSTDRVGTVAVSYTGEKHLYSLPVVL